MKAINKSTLLELANYTREYRNSGNMEIADIRIQLGKELATQAFGRDFNWLSFVDFVDSVLGVAPLRPECTDEELCELFRALKFEVLDE